MGFITLTGKDTSKPTALRASEIAGIDFLDMKTTEVTLRSGKTYEVRESLQRIVDLVKSFDGFVPLSASSELRNGGPGRTG